MGRKKPLKFEELDDREKVEVMQGVIQQTLRLIKMARSKESDYITFNALMAGDSLKDYLAALEEIAHWNLHHNHMVERKASELQLAAADEKRLDRKVHTIRDLALIGTGIGAGVGIVEYFICRVRRRREKRAARE